MIKELKRFKKVFKAQAKNKYLPEKLDAYYYGVKVLDLLHLKYPHFSFIYNFLEKNCESGNIRNNKEELDEKLIHIFMIFNKIIKYVKEIETEDDD